MVEKKDIKQKDVLRFDILSFLEKTKKLIIAIISLVALLLILYYLIKNSVDKKMSITPFTVPKALSDIGYTEIVCSKIYLDEIRKLSTTAKSIYTRKDYKDYEKELAINVPFFDKEISIGTATSFVQRVFNIKVNTITGELSILNTDSVILTTRYNDNLPVISKGRINDLRSIIKKSVEEQFKYFDPYLLASYFNSQKDNEKAVATIKYALSKEPADDDKWAYNLWGAILMENKYYEEARDKFEKSQKLDSNFFLPYYNIGQLEFIDSNNVAASAFYRKSIALNQKFEKGYISLADVYKTIGDLSSAEKTVDTAIQLNSRNSDSYITKGQILFLKGDTAGGVKLIDRAIELNDQEPAYYVKLASIKFLQKQNESSEQLFSKAFHMDTTDLEVAKLYMYSMQLNGDTAMAKEFQKKVVKKLMLRKFAEILVQQWTKERLIH